MEGRTLPLGGKLKWVRAWGLLVFVLSVPAQADSMEDEAVNGVSAPVSTTQEPPRETPHYDVGSLQRAAISLSLCLLVCGTLFVFARKLKKKSFASERKPERWQRGARANMRSDNEPPRSTRRLVQARRGRGDGRAPVKRRASTAERDVRRRDHLTLL